MATGISLSSLASSLASLSFSSHISQKAPPTTLALCLKTQSPASLTLRNKANRRPSISASFVASPEGLDEGLTLDKYVKSRLPGGFAAQRIIGTGRRKCAIARVVLQEGSGKVIINCRDAKVLSSYAPVFYNC